MERTERAGGGGEPGKRGREGGREGDTEHSENINNSTEQKQFIASLRSRNREKSDADV